MSKPKYKASDPIVYNPDGYDSAGFLKNYKSGGKGKKAEPRYKLKPLPKKPSKMKKVLGKLSILLVIYLHLVFIIGVAIPTFNVEGVLWDIPTYITRYIEGPLNSAFAFLEGNEVSNFIFIKPYDWILTEFFSFVLKYHDNKIMQIIVAGSAGVVLFLIDYVDLRLFYYRYGFINNMSRFIIKVLFAFNLVALASIVIYYKDVVGI